MTGTNDAPVAGSDAVAVTEDATTANLWTQLLASDTDVDGGALGIVGGDIAGTLGTVVFDAATQKLTFEADADVHDALEPGQTAVTTFVAHIWDRVGNSATDFVAQSVTVEIEGVIEPNKNNVFSGGDGVDLLQGGNGEDKLVGGEGSDILNGGRGDEVLIGNDDSDIFVFSADSGHDVVTGFKHGEDMLDLRGVLGLDGGAEVFDYLDTDDNGIVDWKDEFTSYSKGRLAISLVHDEENDGSIVIQGVSSLSFADFLV